MVIEKHKILSHQGQFEAILFLNKKIFQDIEEEVLPQLIKREAIRYIQKKLTHVPVKIIRIKIGTVLYFSFINKQEKQNIN